MGQESSQEKAATGSANTPTDPTRTPSAAEGADTANHMFGQIAEAMDASQNRRKSQLLQSPEANHEDKNENEGKAHSPESKKKKRKDRHSGEHGERKKKSKKDKHRKSLDVDSSHLIPEVESFEKEQPSQIQEEAEVLEPEAEEQPKSGSKKRKHKKLKEIDSSQLPPEPRQSKENAIEEQAQDVEPVQTASATQHKSNSETRKHKKSRDAETRNAAPEEESIVTAEEPIGPQQAILSPPSKEQSMPKTQKTKKERRKEKKARQSLSSQLAPDARAATPEEQSQLEESVLEPGSPAMTPAAERQEPTGEAVAEAEAMDVIPESSLRTPATPSVGSKKKLKTFKSAQKKKILSEQIDEHDEDAIPPTQPSQAEQTQVQNSYEPKNAITPDTRNSQSPSRSPAMSNAEVEGQDQEVEAEEEEESEVVVKAKKPKKSKKSKAEKAEEKQKKRRLPIDDVTDTPSKRARLDIQAPPEQEPTKAMLKKARRKAKLAEKESGDEDHEGMLSAKEWEVIDSQLEKYRGINDLSVDEQNRIIQGPVGRKDSPTSQLFTYVMEEIHYRKRWSVIHAMRRKYHDFDKRGAWAPEDDEELMAVYARYPAQWKEIGSRLNRHPDDCRDRYRYVLVCGTNIHWGKWSLDEEQLLQKVVEDILSEIHKGRQEQTAELNEEERAQFYEDAPSDTYLIDWDEVSARMGRRRGPRQCIQKYKIIQKRTPARWAYYAKQEGRAVLQASKMTLKDKINLLELLKEATVEVEDDIDWDDVASKLIELDSEGGISKLTPRFSPKSAKKAWIKLRYLLENANSLEFEEILDTLLDKLSSSGGEDPSKDLFQARIGQLVVDQEARKDLKPAKRTKQRIMVAAIMTLEDKRQLLIKLQKSGAEKEEDVVWPQLFPSSRGPLRKFQGGWEAKKLAWELLSSFLEWSEGAVPAGFQDRVSLLIEKIDSADDQDPTKESFMELIEKKSLQDDLKKFEEKMISTTKDKAAEAAAKEKIVNMPASTKIRILEALKKSGIKDEKDIVWSKHGYTPFMKKGTYNAHAQKAMFQELRATVDKVEDYEFQDLVNHLLTQVSGYTKEERQRQSRGPRTEPAIKSQVEAAQEEENTRRKMNVASKLSSKKVPDDSDDEVDENVVESLNAAANPHGEADADLDAEIDEAGREATTLQTPTTQSSSSAQQSTEKPASADKSSSGSPIEELRKDLYEFDEDELEETILKSAMKKRKTPRKLSVPASPETAEDNSVPEITLEVDSEPEQNKASDDEMPDATAEAESEAEEEDEAADEQRPDASPEAEESFVRSLELEADQQEHFHDEMEDSISQFAALRAQRRKDIQKARSSVVPDSEDEALATTEAIQPSQPPPSSPPLTLAEKRQRKKERKEKREKRRSEKRRSEIAETQEEEIAAAPAVEPREIVREPEDFIPPYMNAKVQSSKEKRAILTAANDKETSPAPEASVEEVSSATQVLEQEAEIEEADQEDVAPPTSPAEKMSEKRRRKKAKKEKRRSEIEETQEDDGPSALDVLVALGSQKKASPPKQAIEDAIPPTSSLMPTMSQVIEQRKKDKKKKRHSDVAPIPEVPETQEEEVEAPVVAEEADAMVAVQAVEADAPLSSIPAPFPDIPTATQEMLPPSSFAAPFPDIPASEDEVPVPSSVPPPSSPPLSNKQRRTRRHAAKAAAQSEADAPARPATPSPEEAPVSNLVKSLRKAGRGRKREADVSVEQLEAQEVEAPTTARKLPRVSVPLFTPRTSRRERRPTEKAMTPYR